eukprot:TRINITY_DN7489_c0_g1_i7.p1 TRINITY_DN7489_c0_g1~~TRINITY_DN7489_c0_g1_i7.p1  ORF type:complete len:314 (-),score=41.39 TRINITY_DN7489_c0_g1_i7:239-1180(-)
MCIRDRYQRRVHGSNTLVNWTYLQAKYIFQRIEAITLSQSSQKQWENTLTKMIQKKFNVTCQLNIQPFQSNEIQLYATKRDRPEEVTFINQTEISGGKSNSGFPLELYKQILSQTTSPFKYVQKNRNNNNSNNGNLPSYTDRVKQAQFERVLRDALVIQKRSQKNGKSYSSQPSQQQLSQSHSLKKRMNILPENNLFTNQLINQQIQNEQMLNQVQQNGSQNKRNTAYNQDSNIRNFTKTQQFSNKHQNNQSLSDRNQAIGLTLPQKYSQVIPKKLITQKYNLVYNSSNEYTNASYQINILKMSQNVKQKTAI